MVAAGALEDALSELDRVAAECFPDLHARLRPPATDAELYAADAELAPFRLPSWLKTLYRWHDGEDAVAHSLFRLWFLPLERAIEEWRWNRTNMLIRPFCFEPWIRDKDSFLITLDYAEQDSFDRVCWHPWGDYPKALFSDPVDFLQVLNTRIRTARESGDLNTWFDRRSMAEYPMDEPVAWPAAWLQRAGIEEPLVPHGPTRSPLLGQGQLAELPDRLPHAGPYFYYLEFVDAGARVAIAGHEVDFADPDLVSHRTRVSCDRLRVMIWFDPERLELDQLRIVDIRFCATE